MEKTDFKIQLAGLYKPKTGDFALVAVPPLKFLMIDGHGDPNVAKEYVDAIEALYAVSYGLKFASKKTLGRDYTVMPLEGLWWSSDMEAFERRQKSDWDWTMMIMQPDWITLEMVEQARASAAAKKVLPALANLRLETFAEGPCLQALFIGPYDDEGPVLARLHHEIMPAMGYGFGGKHHEIYLSDPRKVAPEKLKTILRQPVRKL